MHMHGVVGVLFWDDFETWEWKNVSHSYGGQKRKGDGDEKMIW